MNTVLIVDDHPAMGDLLGGLVRSVLPNADLVTATTLDDALKFASAREFDLVMLDLGLPGYRGVEVLKLFKKHFPHLHVIVVSDHDEPSVISSALRVGAAGFLPKTLRADVMAAALRLIADGGIFTPPQLVSKQYEALGNRATKHHGLTARQLDVLRLIRKRYSNRQIAQRLGITHGTVKQHVHDLLATLGAKSREQAIAEAARRRIRS